MSTLALKVLACVTMLLDHIGYITGNMPLRQIGRLAFPIFLYLICQGYRHTRSPLRYALRLALFGLLSQIPFSLLCRNTLWWDNGNVYFTLLAGLCCVWAADRMSRHRILRWFQLLPAIGVFFLYHYGVISSDYGARAMILIMVFWLLDGKEPHKRLLTLLGFLFSLFYHPILACALGFIRGQGFVFPTVSSWELTQIWSICSLLFIFCYNGKKGTLPGGKLTQYGFYLFYPLHMAILWIIWRFL